MKIRNALHSTLNIAISARPSAGGSRMMSQDLVDDDLLYSSVSKQTGKQEKDVKLT